MKTGKKGNTKLQCRHEAICSLSLNGEPGEAETAVKQCSNCQKHYSEGGGQCKFCVNDINYCSKNCQVKNDLVCP